METPELKMAMNALEFLSQDKEVRRLYEARQKALLDERSALGKARREEKNEIAIKLLKHGMNDSEVVELTGLTTKEVKELRLRLDNKE